MDGLSGVKGCGECRFKEADSCEEPCAPCTFTGTIFTNFEPGEVGRGGIEGKSNDFWNRNPPKSLDRAAILDTAKQLITGPREQDYGTPQANFEAVAAMWNVMLAGKLKSPTDCPISAVDVALCMVALKMARARVTPEKGDTYIDMAGYAALAAELAGAE